MKTLLIPSVILVLVVGIAYAQEPICEPGQIILNGKCADPDEITREELTITLDTDSSYRTGDTINISGTVSRIDSNYHVTILVTNPADDIVLVKQLSPKSNGSFEVTTQARGPLWQVSGTYEIVASYDNKKETAFFVFDGPQSKTQEIEQPKTEVPNTQQELEPAKQQEKQKLPVAKFVDESKDPKDYIERYRAEPEYKDWFERNYSEYPSIYEAVGLPSWVDRLFDWRDSKSVSESDVSNAISYLKSKNQN